MAGNAVKKEELYTWADYRKWPDEERWEVIGGEAYMMSPAPTTRHQSILGALAREFLNYFHNKRCKPFLSPVDVKLSEEDIVQPDIVVVCDEKQIRETHIKGAPALVIEIVSPSSAMQDRMRKMRLYAEAGVKEYWIVTPHPAMVEIFLLDGKSYRMHKAFGRDDILTGGTFKNLKINLKEVFSFPLTAEEKKIYEVKESPAKYRVSSR
ncbi:MAG: Uma2 family endonuclease [Victivallales bacterium]